eukprot:m.53910 g.53910  ORF g.53910 m.53910 type:complete len:823 (+) comp10888_c0_seq1:137-2605(+)
MTKTGLQRAKVGQPKLKDNSAKRRRHKNKKPPLVHSQSEPCLFSNIREHSSPAGSVKSTTSRRPKSGVSAKSHTTTNSRLSQSSHDIELILERNNSFSKALKDTTVLNDLTDSVRKTPSLDPKFFVNGPVLPEPLALKKRGQLPIGSGSSEALVERNPEAADKIRESQDVPDHDTKGDLDRLHRKQVNLKLQAWLTQKKKSSAEEKLQKQQEEDRIKNEEKLQEAKKKEAERAFERWKRNKTEQLRQKRLQGTGDTKGPVTVDEFVCAFRRLNLGEIKLLLCFRGLLKQLNPNGKIEPSSFGTMMHEVDIQLKVDKEILALKDREDKEVPKPNTKPTPKEIEAKRKHALHMRIGSQILKSISPNRQAFGVALESIQGVFQAMDKDGNGLLDKKEFKEGIKRLDLGINATQQLELIKAFDADSSGAIDYSEFENFLIRAKAHEDKEKQHRQTTAKFDLAWTLYETCGQDLQECRFIFEDSLMNALETRKHRKRQDMGTFGLGELRSRLTANESAGTAIGNLSLSQRKDIFKCFEDVYKALDRKAGDKKTSKSGISLDQIDLFLVMILQRHHERQQETQRDPVVAKEEDKRFRVARTILKNAELKGVAFSDILKKLNRTFKSFLLDNKLPYVSEDSFKTALKDLDLGLSTVQILDTSRVWKSNTFQANCVNCARFEQHLQVVYRRLAEDAEWRRDVRSTHVDAFLRAIPARVVPVVIKQLHFQLNHDQLHDLYTDTNPYPHTRRDSLAERRDSLAGRGQVLSAELLASAENPSKTTATSETSTKNPLISYDSSFDITWGPSGKEVPMPPNRTNNKLVELNPASS